jgi:mannose-1-phosphate guanylyltransferase
MKRPQFEQTEQKPPLSILLIDKAGSITKELLSFFPSDAHILVVGAQKPQTTHSFVSYIHFGSLMPAIPDTYYSHILVVVNADKESIRLIPQFVEKARADTAKIFFIMNLFFADPGFVQELIYDYRNAHAIITGDFLEKKQKMTQQLLDFLKRQIPKGQFMY